MRPLFLQELTQRTGKNPNYQYVQIGCSKKAAQAMLHWSSQQVGKPFSSAGMVRSMIWPRETTGDSWYCAELIAACLQVGGLMSTTSNPGEATPRSLYKMYKSRGAIQANPCTLRQEFGAPTQRPLALMAPPAACGLALPTAPVRLQMQSIAGRAAASSDGSRRRSDSPPRMQFKVIQPRGIDARAQTTGTIQLSLASLNMNCP